MSFTNIEHNHHTRATTTAHDIYIYIRRKRSSGALKNSLTSAFIMDENDRWNDIEYSIQRTFSAMCVCVCGRAEDRRRTGSTQHMHCTHYFC